MLPFQRFHGNTDFPKNGLGQRAGSRTQYGSGDLGIKIQNAARNVGVQFRRIAAAVENHVANAFTDSVLEPSGNAVARQIMSFFSNAPDGFQRPTPRSDLDYWNGVTEIQEQLSDPEQLSTIYSAMMKPLMDSTQPNDRFFETRKRSMEAVESYLAGTFSVFGKDHTLRPLARQAVNEDLEKAKGLITEFCSEEYDSEPDFSDLRKVDIAYTTITDEEVPVQISVDLVDFKLNRYIDGIIVDSRKYSSLKELTEQELTDPDFDELVALSEEQLAKVALHGIQNKVVQRLTDNGEEIQVQLHVNGFYYNHYGVVDGTARYIDGPFDTLEDAAEEVRDYHPHAAQVVDSAPDMEEDTFDDVNPQQVREELAKRGIVDGKLVDPEALENTPFIRQVMADAGAAEPPPSLPVLPHSQDRPHALHPGVSADDRRNYHISANDLGIGVPIERFYHNVHAIELLHKLESENRLATPDEQDILSQYVGWGGLPQFFEESNAHYAELKVLLTEDECLLCVPPEHDPGQNAGGVRPLRHGNRLYPPRRSESGISAGCRYWSYPR